MSSNASSNYWEEKWATYIVDGGKYIADGTATYTGGLPGMSACGNVFSYQQMMVRLFKSDPRSGVVYPNSFVDYNDRHATYEPTAAEWDTYVHWLTIRNSASAIGFEAVDLGGGQWAIRNKFEVRFAAPTGLSTGCTITHTGLLLPRTGDAAVEYLIMASALDTPRAIAVGDDLVFAAGTLVYTFS